MSYGPGGSLSFADNVSCVGFDLVVWQLGGSAGCDASAWAYRIKDFEEVLAKGGRVAVLGFKPIHAALDSRLSIANALQLPSLDTSALTMSELSAMHPTLASLMPPEGLGWNSRMRPLMWWVSGGGPPLGESPA